MNGIFKFYQDGKLIAEAENNITQVGRMLAIKTLMGAVPSFGNSLSIGVGESANSLSGSLATNIALDFRVASSKVTSSYLSNSADYDAIVFKARIDDPLSYRIKEVGLFADTLVGGNTNYKTETIVAFEESESWVNSSLASLPTTGDVTRLISISEGAANSSNFRIGDTALQIKSGESAICNSTFSGLDSFENTDLIKLSFYAEGNGSVDVSFYTGASYSTFRFSSGGAGYKVISVQKGSTPQASSGTISWSNITKIAFAAVSFDMVVDGLRFERAYVPDSNTGMISRAVVPTAIQKISNTPLDIEYYLRLGFNV